MGKCLGQPGRGDGPFSPSGTGPGHTRLAWVWSLLCFPMALSANAQPSGRPTSLPRPTCCYSDPEQRCVSGHAFHGHFSCVGTSLWVVPIWAIALPRPSPGSTQGGSTGRLAQAVLWGCTSAPRGPSHPGSQRKNMEGGVCEPVQPPPQGA